MSFLKKEMSKISSFSETIDQRLTHEFQTLEELLMQRNPQNKNDKNK